MMAKVIDNKDYNKEMEKDNMVRLIENWPLKGNSQMEFVVKSTQYNYCIESQKNLTMVLRIVT